MTENAKDAFDESLKRIDKLLAEWETRDARGLTPQQVEGLIDGLIEDSDPLHSKRLSRAQGFIFETGNEDLIKSFKDVARIVMTPPENTDRSDPYGDLYRMKRDWIAVAILEMLGKPTILERPEVISKDAGDKHVFDRIHYHSKSDETYTPALKEALKILEAELTAHCEKQGIRVRTSFDPLEAERQKYERKHGISGMTSCVIREKLSDYGRPTFPIFNRRPYQQMM